MPNKKVNIPELPPDSADGLLQEIDVLHNAILSASEEANPSGENGGLLAIVRLLGGISKEQWDSLAERYHLDQWLAIDLSTPSTREMALLYKNMQDLASRKGNDELTGLPTREIFMRNLQLELERLKRQPADLSVASLDVDGIRQINSKWGHNMGDEALKRLARDLMDTKRVYDTAARMGGEKFALLLPGAGLNRAKAIVQRLLNEFRQNKFSSPSGEEFSVTFSAGIATLSNDSAHSCEQIMEAAEKALKQAKETGCNKVVATQILIEDEIRRSMVHSDEKHFLFFGKHKG